MTIDLSKTDTNLLNLSKDSPGFTFDSENFYRSIDLLCEGPIEGLSDIYGNTLNYIDLSTENTSTNANSLAYGVYYNDVSVKDRKSNLFNLSSSDFSLSLGTERSNSSNKSSSIYEYKNKIYDLPNTINEFSTEGGAKTSLTLTKFSDLTDVPKLLSTIDLKNSAKVFTHYVKNKYADQFKVIISIDELYYISENGTNYNNIARFVISFTNSFKRETQYLLVELSMIARQNPVLLTFDLSLDDIDKQSNSINSQFLISVYSVQKRLAAVPTNKGSLGRQISVNSVIETINLNFAYPFSVLCKNKISAKHFSSIPVRSFDCKLLKIKIPDNYDAEAREYDGDWSGNFSKSIKWSDNPAWIFNDLCTNSRYGLAKSVLDENDINKWELYKISKYCDELIKTNCSTKYAEDSFTYDNTLSVDSKNFNCISFTTTDSLDKLNQKYPLGNIIYLYDLKNTSGQIVEKCVKKIIGNITKSGYTATIRLYNDFGPRKFIESDINGSFFSFIKQYILTDPDNQNIQDSIKQLAVYYITGTANTIFGFNTSTESISLKYSQSKIFDSSYKIASGKCVAKHVGFDDFLEPRFSANILINNQTEALKVLSDLSSVFRGIFYFRNGFLNLTSDVVKPVSYVFNNSNIKNGLFTYSSNNLNQAYSIAKVAYLDKNDNFKDKIVYVEDPKLIEKYGIVENEILGFGTTSKYQAQRIGKWFLTTGKLESEIVNFTGGLEISMLKIGDIIRVSDSLKNNNIEYGRIVSLDRENNYIYIDREVSEDSLGKIIKIFSLINDELTELTYYVSAVDNVNLRLKLDIKAYISWNVVNKVLVSNDNRTVSGDNLGGNVWSRKAFTKQSYINDCQISFTIPYIETYLICGLSEVNNITNNQNDINYGFGSSGGTLYAIENGTIIAFGITSISKNDKLSVIYDGNYISYYLNQTLLRQVSRSKGNPLYGVCAFYTQYAAITNLVFSPFPDFNYGSFSYLRSDASFTIYLKNFIDDGDLYRLISISENSSNEYSVSAMRYSYEKFDYVEKDEFINPKLNTDKEIIFSTDNHIYSVFTETEIQNHIKEFAINFNTANNSNFDYSFSIDEEYLTSGINENKYIKIDINFISLFSISRIASNPKIYGITCIINKNGKTLKFKIYKNNAKFISVFLGEVPLNSLFYSPKYSIDFYAFDSNLKLINV